MTTKLLTLNLSRTKKLNARKLASLLATIGETYGGQYGYSEPAVKMTAEGIVVEVQDGYA